MWGFITKAVAATLVEITVKAVLLSAMRYIGKRLVVQT